MRSQWHRAAWHEVEAGRLVADFEVASLLRVRSAYGGMRSYVPI